MDQAVENPVRSHADALLAGYFQLGTGVLLADVLAKQGARVMTEAPMLLILLAVATVILFRVLGRHAREKGYTGGWAWCALLSVGGAIVVISLPRRRAAGGPPGFEVKPAGRRDDPPGAGRG